MRPSGSHHGFRCDIGGWFGMGKRHLQVTMQSQRILGSLKFPWPLDLDRRKRSGFDKTLNRGFGRIEGFFDTTSLPLFFYQLACGKTKVVIPVVKVVKG